ncbi:hypothetical protein T492DRAFT_838280 [Pavlovales sp. CCMP2436]|nr:hypothetical protein T492DRAFT_838280 [Pavlovales sp. CCMP2436]
MKFGKKLTDASRESWEDEYVNYKRLKQLLKAGIEPAVDGAPVPLATYAAAEGAFLAQALHEVHKVNSFFARQEQLCSDRLNCFAAVLPQLLAALAARPPDPSAEARPSLPQIVEHLAAEVARGGGEGAPDALSGASVEAMRDFVRLCDDIDALRKYAFMNYLAVTKSQR